MIYKKIYDAVKAEFNDEIALTVVQILTINLSKKIKKKDMIVKGIFRDKVLTKAKKVLWEVDDDTFDLAVKIWDVYPSWNTRQSLHGLGGCTIKTFKELLDDEQFIDIADKISETDTKMVRILIEQLENNADCECIGTSWGQFECDYEPINNHFTKKDYDIIFGKDGEEYDYIKHVFVYSNKNTVWTLVLNDNDDEVLLSGFHKDRVVGYVITKKPFNDNEYIEVSH